MATDGSQDRERGNRESARMAFIRARAENVSKDAFVALGGNPWHYEDWYSKIRQEGTLERSMWLHGMHDRIPAEYLKQPE